MRQPSGFVEKCLNFNFKLTGLLFIQEKQREGKIFFTRKTSVFKLNEYVGEDGSKVQSYYEYIYYVYFSHKEPG